MIITDKCVIRTIDEKDIETLHGWNSDKFRGMYQEFNFESKQSLVKQFNEDGFCSEKFMKLLIEVESTPVGLLYINFIRNGLAEIGLVICETGRHKGLGTQVTLAIVQYLFENYDIVRIQSATDVDNFAAQRVLEKCGFEKEGVMRKNRYHHGKYCDSILYSIIR